MSRRISFGLIGFVILVAFTSCQKDQEPTGHNPVVRKPIYSKSIPVSELNEISCDSVPDYFEPPYRLEYAESGWISNIAQNPNNDQQWAFSIETLESKFSRLTWHIVYVKDFQTRKINRIDSAEDLMNFAWGGRYLAYVINGATTVLYDTETGERQEMHGFDPKISPDGKWMKIQKFENGSRQELINLESGEVSHSWNTGEIGSGIFSNSSIYYFNYTDDHIKQIKRFDIKNMEDHVFMNDIDFYGDFTCFIGTERLLTNYGVIVNLKTKTTEVLPPLNSILDTNNNCQSKWLEPLEYLPWEEKILCKKRYYDFNPDNNVVTHYIHYHILNLDGSQEERVQLNF